MKRLAWILAAVAATACGTTANNSGPATVVGDATGDGVLGEDAVDDAVATTPTDAVTGDGVGTDAVAGDDAVADAAADLDAVADQATTTDQDAAVGDGDVISPDVKPACSAQTCDDADPCTDDGCDLAGACVHAPKPGCGTTPIPCNQPSDCSKGKCDLSLHICVACETTTDCAGAGLCVNQKCVAAVACASDGQCKASNQVCDKTAGFCVDCIGAGDCKVGESCTANHCAPAPSKCASSKDCPGILVCDKGAGVCVGCVQDGDCGTGLHCKAGECLAKTCVTPVCTGGNVWNCNADGTGYVASPISCDDGQICTADLCVPGTGCAHGANSEPCSDSNACTSGDLCADSKCGSGKATDCNDQNACTNDSCQPASGCVHLANGATTCDDGSACTSNDACVGTQCVGKATVNCDDGNDCTADACDKAGCTHTNGAGSCEDGNPCTVSDTCAAGTCGAGMANTCDDGNECTTDACDAKTGCTHALKSGCTPVSLPPCATNTDCTGGTVCETTSHTCVACLKDADCGSGAICEAHVCKAAVTCQSDVQCKATKQVCNTTAKACVDCNFPTDCATDQQCQANACVTVKACASSKECTFGVCDQKNGVCVGCLSDPDCTDAQFCGSDHICHADVCNGPVCNGMSLWTCNSNGSGYTGAVTCNDGVTCTLDSCAAKACTHTAKFDPSAFELPGNGLDDNCDGKTDDVPLCDTGLSSATDGDYAKALDLCSGVSDSPVISSSKARAIRGKFGSTFAPQAGSNMVMLSTGIAAAEGEAGYAAPQSGTNFNAPASSGIKLGKCTGTSALDAINLRIKVTVPPNATAMSFDFAFFSTEYPEYIGQQYSDSFVAVVTGLAYSGDVVGDALGKCFNANDITFTTCPEAACSKGATGLTGTGYEGDKVGGGYGWATASFAVKAGDAITIEFAVYDVADGVYDTAVLLDSLRFTNASVSKPTIVAK
jgi:hypothetical protein